MNLIRKPQNKQKTSKYMDNVLYHWSLQNPFSYFYAKPHRIPIILTLEGSERSEILCTVFENNYQELKVGTRMCVIPASMFWNHYIFIGFSQSSWTSIYGNREKLNWSYLCPFYAVSREQRWKLVALLIVLVKVFWVFSFIPAVNLIWKQLFDSYRNHLIMLKAKM